MEDHFCHSAFPNKHVMIYYIAEELTFLSKER